MLEQTTTTTDCYTHSQVTEDGHHQMLEQTTTTTDCYTHSTCHDDTLCQLTEAGHQQVLEQTTTCKSLTPLHTMRYYNRDIPNTTTALQTVIQTAPTTMYLVTEDGEIWGQTATGFNARWHFINETQNNRGSSTVHCGTPVATLMALEDKWYVPL